MPWTSTNRRLSQMILDRVFNGVLDHSAGCLIVFDEQGPDVCLKEMFTNVIENVWCCVRDSQAYEHCGGFVVWQSWKNADSFVIDRSNSIHYIYCVSAVPPPIHYISQSMHTEYRVSKIVGRQLRGHRCLEVEPMEGGQLVVFLCVIVMPTGGRIYLAETERRRLLSKFGLWRWRPFHPPRTTTSTLCTMA